MKFKDEQGNFVTPRKGDYVLASDIKDEEMHNRVRDAFGAAGCAMSSYGNYKPDEEFKPSDVIWNSVVWGTLDQLQWVSSGHTFCVRRIIPHQKTLFEAACEAEDGTRWTLLRACEGNDIIKRKDYLQWVDGGEHIPFFVYQRTDFEQLPSGPKKRDTPSFTVTSHAPSDKANKCADAFGLIGRLMQWEGAQIGEAGFTINLNLKEAYYLDDVFLPHEVTFETAEQCEAAWKAECPEMFDE